MSSLVVSVNVQLNKVIILLFYQGLKASEKCYICEIIILCNLIIIIMCVHSKIYINIVSYVATCFSEH